MVRRGLAGAQRCQADAGQLEAARHAGRLVAQVERFINAASPGEKGNQRQKRVGPLDSGSVFPQNVFSGLILADRFERVGNQLQSRDELALGQVDILNVFLQDRQDSRRVAPPSKLQDLRQNVARRGFVLSPHGLRQQRHRIV